MGYIFSIHSFKCKHVFTYSQEEVIKQGPLHVMKGAKTSRPSEKHYEH